MCPNQQNSGSLVFSVLCFALFCNCIAQFLDTTLSIGWTNSFAASSPVPMQCSRLQRSLLAPSALAVPPATLAPSALSVCTILHRHQRLCRGIATSLTSLLLWCQRSKRRYDFNSSIDCVAAVQAHNGDRPGGVLGVRERVMCWLSTAAHRHHLRQRRRQHQLGHVQSRLRGNYPASGTSQTWFTM